MFCKIRKEASEVLEIGMKKRSVVTGHLLLHGCLEFGHGPRPCFANPVPAPLQVRRLSICFVATVSGELTLFDHDLLEQAARRSSLAVQGLGVLTSLHDV